MFSNLMAKTGNTQGIKFNNKPPAKAPSKAKTQVAQGAVNVLPKEGAAILSLSAVFGSSANSRHCPCTGVSNVHCKPVGASALPWTSNQDIFDGLSILSLETRTCTLGALLAPVESTSMKGAALF